MSVVTREHLYEEIWAEPMTTVAKRYGVSSNYLARICERLKVPRPPRGYWAKLKVGKAFRRVALPAARPSDEHVWRTSDFGHVPLEQAPTAVTGEPLPPRPRATIVRGGLHALVRDSRPRFEHAKHDAHGYLRPDGSEVLEILVSKPTVKRAFAFMNALLLALEKRGHDVVFAPRDRRFVVGSADLPDEDRSRWPERSRWRPRRATVAFVGEVAVGLTLVELNEEMPAKHLWEENLWVRDTDKAPKQRDARLARLLPPLRAWLPNHRLRLRAYSPYPMTTWSHEWHDGDAKLETQVQAIVTGVEVGAQTLPPLIARARLEYDERCRKLEEERRAWEARQAREAYERATKTSHQGLLALVRDWSQAEDIRRFLAAAEADLADAPPADREVLAAKLALARDMLGSPRSLDWLAAWTEPPAAPPR
ncbi:MAG: hypothetical protein AB7S26_30750 [Sandaracinaceae bacterium]